MRLLLIVAAFILATILTVVAVVDDTPSAQALWGLLGASLACFFAAHFVPDRPLT